MSETSKDKNIDISGFNNNQVDIKQILGQYIIHWKWFALSAIVCVIAASVYLRYVSPMYNISATILIKDDKKGGLASELSAFADMGVIKGAKSNTSN